ncbi:MAG TPA: MFS transporter [Candidatus Limnocylindrales bacterium]|nr:MFS transporter [Candidatus Limnocylindrales bacterium]
MTGNGRVGRVVHRGFGRFHRDARLILVTSLVAGAAISLWWIDFNLYLRALGYETSTIGLVSTLASLAGGLVAFPASAASDRFGRRAAFIAGLAAGIVALACLLASEALPVIILSAALWSIGNQTFQVVVSPYMTEHSEPEHRNELFAIQFAIQNVTNIVAAILGGVVATAIAAAIGLEAGGPGTYRIILVFMTVLLVAGLVSVLRLSDDRPSRTVTPRLRRLGEPAAFPADPRRSRTILGITVRDRVWFAKLVLPGFLISIGAGQVIPFLNLYVQGKFGLDLAQLNAVFALTSLGTVVAILLQPTLARRFGQITSVVIVQGASIPFLVVLGFSPILWTVILAMAVRNSLMNAGNPIFNAFAMEQVSPIERATLAAAMSVLWQIGWVIGGIWYAVLQATVGFDAGYAINFLTIITLYTTATCLYWIWFRHVDRRRLREPAPAAA